MNKKISPKTISIIFSVLVVCFAVGSYIYGAWTEPTTTPPGGNVSAPINVSSVDQTKQGGLTLTESDDDTVLTLGRQGGTFPTNFRQGVDNALIINNNNSDILTIKNGNVGIGTTASPSQKLDVAGHINMSGAVSRTIFYGTSGAAVPGAASVGEKIQLYGTTGTVGVSDYALGIESNNMWFNTGSGYKWYSGSVLRMTMLGTGNVGIGDPSPLSLLTVGSGDLFQVNSSGNIVKINNIAYSWPSAQGAASTFLQNNGSGILSWVAAGGGGISGSGTLNYLSKWSAATSLTNSLIYDNGTNVGIGTVNPGTNKLEVVGGPIKATGGLIIETRASDPASPATGQMWLRTDI